MGYLSPHLSQYLKSAHLSEQTPVRVVVRVSQPPSVTISRVPTTARDRSIALEALRATGLSGHILSSSTFQPQRILQGVSAITTAVTIGELERLAESPGVEYVRPVRMHKMHLDVSVGLLGVDAGVRSRYDGTGVRVAVIDSGIDYTHPDLRGRVNLELSYNFTNEGSSTEVMDGNGHGTHVAGIIGGAGTTYRGVAPGVEFLACKIFDSSGRTAEEDVVRNAVRWAVEKGAHVINYSGGYTPVITDRVLGQIVLVEPPWVWPMELLSEEDEFKSAVDHGIVAVVSAGNEGLHGRRGTLSMPATCPAVISVGSVDKQQHLSGFSSVGPAYRSAQVSHADMVQTLTSDLEPSATIYAKVDVVTPGGEVDATVANAGGCFYLPGIISVLAQNANEREACIVDSRYVRMSGTSQAAPHIAGLAALILQAAQSMHIDLSPQRAYVIKGILQAAAQPVGDAPHDEHEQGRGVPRWENIESILRDISAGRTVVSRFV